MNDCNREDNNSYDLMRERQQDRRLVQQRDAPRTRASATPAAHQPGVVQYSTRQCTQRCAVAQLTVFASGQVVWYERDRATSPIRVEFHKGVGLARYFRKRAEGVTQRVVAWLLLPVVVGAAVVRPLLWRFRGRAG